MLLQEQLHTCAVVTNLFTCYSNRISSIFFPWVLLTSVPPGCGYNSRAGIKQGQGQYRLGAHAVLRASACALCYDTKCSLLSQPRYLLGRHLPSLQVLQCTRWSSVPRCKLCNQTFVPGAHPPCVDFIIVRLEEIIPKFYPLFYSFIPNGFTYYSQSSHLLFSM